MKAALAWALLFAFVPGCALTPQPNTRLEEARVAVASLDSDAESRRLAPVEVESAREAFRRATEAWESLQDPAYVDHLAYVAKQRAAIAAATARSRKAPERCQWVRMP